MSSSRCGPPRMRDNVLDLTQVRRALVIDDEGAVRGVLRRYLSRRGWMVEEAPDGGAALEQLRGRDDVAHGEAFDVIICDLRMPALSGQELHAWALRHRPDLVNRLVFSSGDVQEEAAATFLEQCGRPVLAKPFELSRLEAILASVVRQS